MRHTHVRVCAVDSLSMPPKPSDRQMSFHVSQPVVMKMINNIVESMTSGDRQRCCRSWCGI